MGEKYDYLKVKKVLQEKHQLPPERLHDETWEAELKQKEDEDQLNQLNKLPEELVILEKDDYDYYKAKKAIGLR